MKTCDLRMVTKDGGDERQKFSVPPHSELFFGKNAVPRSIPALGTFDYFPLLPAAAVASGTDSYGTVTGTGTAVITQSTKGGMNLQTKVLTPALNDNVFYAAVANTGFHLPATIASLLAFETQVAIGATAAATMYASFGLNQNVTAVDPTATAGDGEMFLYDPTKVVNTGLTTAQHKNWILVSKVAGVNTFTDSGILVVAGQDYNLRVDVGADLKAVFRVDNVVVGTGPVMTSGATLKVFLGAQLTATPAGQADFDCRYAFLGRSVG